MRHPRLDLLQVVVVLREDGVDHQLRSCPYKLPQLDVGEGHLLPGPCPGVPDSIVEPLGYRVRGIGGVRQLAEQDVPLMPYVQRIPLLQEPQETFWVKASYLALVAFPELPGFRYQFLQSSYDGIGVGDKL